MCIYTERSDDDAGEDGARVDARFGALIVPNKQLDSHMCVYKQLRIDSI